MWSMKTAALVVYGLLGSAHAHVTMQEPKQWHVPEVVRATVELSDGNLNPLQADGSNFPCHGVPPEAPVATYAPGTKQKLKLLGSAVHGGGSGQMSITYDTKPGKNTVFRVMTSYMGDHPIKAKANLNKEDRDPHEKASQLDLYALNPLSFTVPAGMPAGKAVVAWTWFNRIGNREMYMQCSTVIISGTETSTKVFDSLPEIFKANINGGKCVVSDQVTAILFRNPGPEIFGNGITPIPCGESPRNVEGGYGRGASSSSPAPAPTMDSGPDSANLPPAPTNPTTTAPEPTTFAVIMASGSPNRGSNPTPIALPTPTDSVCTEGEITCNSDGTWSMCGSGRVQNMGKTAAGMTCKDGKIVRARRHW